MFARKFAVLAAAALALTVTSDVAAQASFTPAYNSPYRSFDSMEFGGILSFPDGNSDFAAVTVTLCRTTPGRIWTTSPSAGSVATILAEVISGASTSYRSSSVSRSCCA